MYNSDINPFWCLGRYIWDLERLAALEFLNLRKGQKVLPSDVVLSKNNLWFIWQSIYSKEKLEEREDESINQFPEVARGFGSTKKETY
jgi:hypothetical protein